MTDAQLKRLLNTQEVVLHLQSRIEILEKKVIELEEEMKVTA